MFATKDSFPPYMKHKHNSGKKKKNINTGEQQEPPN